MSVAYSVGFDTTAIGTFTVVVGGTVGPANVSVSGLYAHRNLSSIVPTYTSNFATAIVAALEAALPTPVWACSLNTTTWLYTISSDIAFTLTWTGDAGTNLRRALGYSASATPNATSAVGTIRPYYLIVAEIAGRSGNSKPYEPQDIAQEAVSDGGTAYSVSRDTDELWADWLQPMEPKAAVFARNATATVPWTWQHAIKHMRAEQPFVVDDSVTGEAIVYRLRAESASFVPEPVYSDLDTLWNIPLACRDLGSL